MTVKVSVVITVTHACTHACTHTHTHTHTHTFHIELCKVNACLCRPVHHFGGYSKTCYKKLVTHVESHAIAVKLLKGRE